MDDVEYSGGGSRLFYKNDLFVVGPESVGAHPGPACYRKGGEVSRRLVNTTDGYDLILILVFVIF